MQPIGAVPGLEATEALPPLSTPGAIRQLDDAAIALIAAGEVVERPTSAVKELAENAIDAGATAISIEIRRGGFELLRVRDDGSGIDPADLPLALARHATSKLRHADDLLGVRTLGFRGEALASIAAVSRLRLVTRTRAGAAGASLVATAGDVEGIGPSASAPGTTVTVEDLFFNVPARHAFQRSPAGEARAIVHLVSQLALATPGIRWTVNVDGRDALVTPGGGSLREAAVAVHGAAIAPHLLDVPMAEEPDGSIRVSGVVSSPAVHRNVRTYSTCIVNGRVVRSQSLSHAIEDAYHALLPHGRHPVAVVHVEVPSDEIDVNVHPTKLEVRLRRERLAYARVRDGVRGALSRWAPARQVAPTVPEWDAGPPIAAISPGPTSPSFRNRGILAPGGGGILGGWGNLLAAGDGREQLASDVAWAGLPADPGETPASDDGQARRRTPADLVGQGAADVTQAGMRPGQSESRDPVAPTEGRHVPDLAAWRPLGQVGLTYVVVEAPDGMYLIDQHSAHERVQYEALKAAARTATPLTQPLLVPEVIDLTPAQAAWLDGHAPVLRGLGFDLEPFGAGLEGTPDVAARRGPGPVGWGPQAWLLRAVPAIAAARGKRPDVASLIDNLIDREYGDGPMEDQARWAVACHSSVRAGDRLAAPEMQALIESLARCDLRQTCPHGRPTMIHLSHSQLAREFGRSGIAAGPAATDAIGRLGNR